MFIILCTICIALVYIHIKWLKNYWKRRHIPVPPDNTFLSTKMKITEGQIDYVEKNLNAYQWTLKNYPQIDGYGTYFILWQPAFVPTNPDLIRLILTKDSDKFIGRGLYANERDDPVGAHLFTLDGTKWRRLRIKLTPTFTANKMRLMFPILVNYTNLLVKHLKCQTNPIQPKQLLAKFTMSVISDCAFGLELDAFNNEESPFVKYCSKYIQIDQWRGLQLLIMNNFHNFARFLRMKSVQIDVSDFFTNIVKNTVEHRQKNHIKRHDFLQLLIDLLDNPENGLSLNEIIAQSFLFFLAGFESSSMTMTYALYEMAKNPEIQKKCRQEILDTIQKNCGQITYESLAEMSYLHKIIEETLRKYPTLTSLMRLCVENYKIPNSDIILEKGTRIRIPVLGLHYDPKYYPKPHIFDPERFNKKTKAARHSYVYLPFGEGPRQCIGMRFGLMQSKMGLIKILKNFTCNVNKNTVEPIEFTDHGALLKSKTPIWLNFHPIKN